MSLKQHDQFSGEPDPENPGWLTWNLADDSRFNGQAMGHLLARAEGERVARLRLQAAHKHSNLHGRVHGGATLALIDIAMFSATRILLGPRVTGSVTLDLTTQFIGSGAIGEPQVRDMLGLSDRGANILPIVGIDEPDRGGGVQGQVGNLHGERLAATPNHDSIAASAGARHSALTLP